jgi:hypothetical protein
MPSHYDEKAKCRVGEMDKEQFFAECDADSVAFFKALLAAWAKAGGTLKWGAGGVGLRIALGQEGKAAKECGVCFLAPKFAGKQDRIELGCTTLVKQIGQDRVNALQAGLRAAAGEQVKGTTMMSVVRPGQLPAKGQKAVIDALRAVVERA